MPSHKSAEKRMRQSERRREINRSNRARVRTSIKKMRGVLDGGNPQDMQSMLPTTISEIDKAVQKGALHRNAAARQKSRLTARANKARA
jgi:small subunit ribosomal protein S20